MTCPKCGLQTASEQRFCRSCGASLQMMTQPLEPTASQGTPPIVFKDQKERANSLVLWGMIIMFIGAAVGVTGKMLMHQELVTVVGIFVSLVGMFLTVYPYLSPSRRQEHVSSSSSQPEALTQSQPPKHLPSGSNIEYVPSITERTTNLLQDSVATRPKQKEDRESQA